MRARLLRRATETKAGRRRLRASPNREATGQACKSPSSSARSTAHMEELERKLRAEIDET